MRSSRYYCGVAVAVAFFVTAVACSGNPGAVATVKVPPAPRPESSGISKMEDSHRLRAEKPARMRVAVWPFLFHDRNQQLAMSSAGWVLRTLEEVNTEGEAVLATNAVVSALANDPYRRFDVLERTHIAPVVAEHKMEVGDAADLAALIKAGQLLNAQYIVVGACMPGAKPGEFSLAIRLIETGNKGRVKAAQTGVCLDCDSERLRRLALNLAKKLFLPTAPFDDANWADDVLPGTKD